LAAVDKVWYDNWMKSISVEEMQRDLPTYIRLVQHGETVVIVEAQQPVAELIPIEKPRSKTRPYGLCTGEFEVPEGFDAPLPNEILHSESGT
jgi:antitoxin (DNA-binding transcriptional repressor) of toxin-antitoxin stability system